MYCTCMYFLTTGKECKHMLAVVHFQNSINDQYLLLDNSIESNQSSHIDSTFQGIFLIYLLNNNNILHINIFFL